MKTPTLTGNSQLSNLNTMPIRVPGMSGEDIHALIYDLAKEVGLQKTNSAFESIYRAFLGRSRGPRAGWFLAFLDRDLVIARLKEAGGTA